MDKKCRITVVGGERKVDLAVSAGAPIATYVDTLAKLCERDEPQLMPPAWTLGAATGGPFAPEWSLSELGIADGEVLYLRDVIADEYAEPVVHDVEERVSEVTDGMLNRRWDVGARTVTVMVFGMVWFVAALVALAIRAQVDAGVLGALALTAGLVLPTLAWVAAERGWPVPAPLCSAVALCAVPVQSLAIRALVEAYGGGGPAGWHGSTTGTGLTVAALVTGAFLGALLALAAVPGTLTCAVALALGIAAALGLGLGLLRADAAQYAAVVAVVAFVLLTIAPRTVTSTVAFASRRVGMRTPLPSQEDTVKSAVRAATLLLMFWSGGLCAVLAVALPTMAASGSVSAVAEAGLLALALLIRAGGVRLVAEVVPLALAGSVGLFALLLTVPPRIGEADWAAPTYVLLVPIALLAYGFRRLMRSPELPSMERPRWLTGLGSLPGGLAVVFAVATFGVLSSLVHFGHRL